MKTRQKVALLILGLRNMDGQTRTPHKVDGERALDVTVYFTYVMLLSLYSSRFIMCSLPAVSPLFFSL